MQREYSGEILGDPGHFITIACPDGPIQIEAARVIVTCSDGSHSHVVAWSGFEPWPDSFTPDILRDAFPADTVACILADAFGDTTLSPPASDDETLLRVAVAAAILKRSWGWDESPRIIVRFAGRADAFDLDPVHDGKTWRVKSGLTT